MVVWAEQGTLWCNNIPLLATNDMPQPGCVCYTPICCHSLCTLILKSVCMDVHCTNEPRTSLSGRLMQRGKACVPFECTHANLSKLSDFPYAANYTLCKRSGGLSVCLCMLWLPKAPLTVSTRPRTWVINRKECAPCCDTPDTAQQTASYSQRSAKSRLQHTSQALEHRLMGHLRRLQNSNVWSSKFAHQAAAFPSQAVTCLTSSSASQA